MAQSGGQGTMRAVAIVALSAAAAFAAVYATFAPRDNGSPATPPASTAPAPAETRKETGSEMAAFVRRVRPAPVPELTFKDGTGRDVRLSDFKGKVVLLNLWATWCAPCREEMPALDRLQQALGGDKFEVVALCIDRQGADAARKFLTSAGVNALKLYIDATGQQGGPINIVGMPTTLLIDAAGNEVGRLTGPAVWDSEAAQKLIRAAMNGPP